MSTTNSSPTDFSPMTTDAVEAASTAAAKTVCKRYEGLVAVRTKAVNGKGAWYWAHLEPVLVRSGDTGLAKAVKLKCCLCNAVFSASNPSRTASEHLKRGTCPNFSSGAQEPVSPLSPSPLASIPSPSSNNNHRKRGGSHTHTGGGGGRGGGVGFGGSLVHGSSRCCGELGFGYDGLSKPHLMLSGGKEDLGALAMLEDSVKKLKSPKSSAGPLLSKERIDTAIDLLADWFYESCGSVSLSSLDHPKFRSFLGQVGLPGVSWRDISGARLDSKFDEAKMEVEARIRDSMFFQVSAEGWKRKGFGFSCADDDLVKLTVNLPNGTSVFQKAVFTNGALVPANYAEETLWETVTSICGSVVQRCVGIVADKYKGKALRNLEIKNHWMVNISCQLQGFISLIKDFTRDLKLFESVTENALKMANFFNCTSQIRSCFCKYQLQELDHAGFLRVPECKDSKKFVQVYAMLEDIMSHARVLQLVVLDDAYKPLRAEDPVAAEVGAIVQDMGFWNELDAVRSLVTLIRDMAQEIETERPLVGQCLPLWQELRTKVRDWCVKFSIPEGPVEKIVEKRFRKNYHPAWAAAFILDPVYLARDTSGKYLPPFKCLTHEQEKDVDRLITRLVTREEAHVALMELMKWRTEGLDPLYAKAVQVKQQDPVSGKMRIANPQSSRLVWETYLSEFRSLRKVAVRLIFLHATSCGLKCNWSLLRWVCLQGHSRVGLERAQKMVFIAAHAKLGRRDFSNEEDKDAELFALANGDHEMLNEVFAVAPSVFCRFVG